MGFECVMKEIVGSKFWELDCDRGGLGCRGCLLEFGKLNLNERRFAGKMGIIA